MLVQSISYGRDARKQKRHGCAERGTAFWLVAALMIGAMHADWALAAQPKALGFVLTGRHVAMPPTPEKEQCPDGYQFNGIVDNWNAQFPTEALSKAQQARCGSRENRGPNCENMFYNPTAVKDLLPFREAQSKTAYGMNLDGTPDGRATDRTCAHQKFANVDGGEAVDNQFYRAHACEQAWRAGGVYEEFGNRVELIDREASRVLLEVTDVDNERNDTQVTVTIYKGKDLLQKNNTGQVQAWQSQRIDERVPQYVQRTRGKIVDGVLITEPMEVRLPVHLMGLTGELQLSDMRMRLALKPDGADGLMAGYHDIDEWWKFYSKISTVTLAGMAPSPPSKYEALHRLADGEKDPISGRCGAVSTAYKLDWTRAFIVHPPAGQVAAATARNERASEIRTVTGKRTTESPRNPEHE
ncbi:MAG: hypothetical protein ABW110_19780 [Steroidobacteraceae bacterium]